MFNQLTKLYIKNQKFQIGDVCKIVHTDNTMQCPIIKDEEDPYVGLTVIIIGSHYQLCGNSPKKEIINEDGIVIEKVNLSDYAVYAPAKLNPTKCTIIDGEHGGVNYMGIMISGKELEWAWVNKCQLKFIHKLPKHERSVVLEKYQHWKRK